jgi:energy-coupling factor transporter transmembrane protein EcfT
MPFRFEWGDHPARRLHPLAKLGSLVALSIGVSAAEPLGLAALVAAAVAALALAGAFHPSPLGGAWALARQARFLLPLGLLVVAFRVLDLGGPPFLRVEELRPTGLYLARLAVIFAYAEAFFRSTSAAELSCAASRAARAAARRGDIDPGLYLSLAIGFIPRCMESWERSREAAVVRGYGGRHRRFRSSLLLLESFVANSLRGALTTADALQARGYVSSRSLPTTAVGGADAAVLLASIALAVAASLG